MSQIMDGPVKAFTRNWNCSWRLDQTIDSKGALLSKEAKSAKFTRTERFARPGEQSRTKTANELQKGQALVRRMMGPSLYNSEKQRVMRRIRPTIPGPGYVQPDSIGDDVPGGKFSAAKRFRASLKWLNNVRDAGWHNLSRPGKSICHDSAFGYIEPVKTNRARAPKCPGKQPPHSYLGPGFADPNDLRPKTVADVNFRSKTNRFESRFWLGPETPGPGSYRRPVGSCTVKNFTRPSPAFASRSVRKSPLRPSESMSGLNDGEDSLDTSSHSTTSSKIPGGKWTRPKAIPSDEIISDALCASTMLTGGGLGAGKFPVARAKSPEPDPELGPGCYSGVGDIMLRLMPRRSPAVKFSTSNLKQVAREKLDSGDMSRSQSTGTIQTPTTSAIMWPREKYAEPSSEKYSGTKLLLNTFWDRESEQNGRESVKKKSRKKKGRRRRKRQSAQMK